MDLVKVLMVSGSDTNVGKTTIAKNLKSYLASEFNRECLIMSVDEAYTPSDGEDKRFSISDAVDLSGVIESVMLEFYQDKSIILDIGGNTYDKVIEAMHEHDGTIEDLFDYFLVPVTYSIKEDRLAARIQELIDSGVDAHKIFIVVNNVTSSEIAKTPPAAKFPLLARLEKQGVTLITESIMKSSLIIDTRGRGPVSDHLASQTMDEYKESIKKAIQDGDEKLAKALAGQVGKMGLARSTHKSFVTVFDKIFKC